IAVRAALGVVGRPAGGVLKEANRTNAPLLAKIEPMPRAAGNAKQVTGFDRDGDDFALARANVKESAPFNDKTDFILVVPVLGVEAVEHGVETGRLGADVNDVGGDVAAFGFQPVDFGRVGGENLGGRRIGSDLMGRFPSFVGDTDGRQVVADLGEFGQCAIFIWNVQNRHNNSSGSLP